jgi:FkbM family methyltransferase
MTLHQAANRRIKTILKRVPVVHDAARAVHRRLFPPLEVRLADAVDGRADLFFVQVGSNDGLHGDPIRDLVLAHESWRGIFIEPVPFLFDRLRTNYAAAHRFIFENVAIGTFHGTRKFYYLSELAAAELGSALPVWHDQLGSFDRHHVAACLEGWLHPSIADRLSAYIVEDDIACEPLQHVLDRHGVAAIDLLHIDTEGFDYQVLLQVDFRRYRPKAILFEQKHLSPVESRDAFALLRQFGYRLFSFPPDVLAVAARRD